MIRAICLFFLVGSCLSATTRNFVWFPTDTGAGVVPAFLDASPESIQPSPAAADPANIHFFLYTRQNPNTPQEIENTTASFDRSNWDRNAPVLIFAHGFSSSYTGGSSGAIQEGFMGNDYPSNVNLVLIDWEKAAAAPWYDFAAASTRDVGAKAAYFINFAVSNGYTTAANVRAGGHSLGAHVAGFLGADFQKLQNGQKLARITGLDPALPRFGAADDEGRLDPTDGAFVDVVHTASGTLAEGELAFIEPRGHLDFYPNKGRNQPGCVEIAGECSHSRCYQYFVESIGNNLFRSCKCNDDAWDPEGIDKFTSCDCAKGSAQMGEWVDQSARGIYHLTTNSRAPFAQG